jgi:hypothetical protein
LSKRLYGFRGWPLQIDIPCLLIYTFPERLGMYWSWVTGCKPLGKTLKRRIMNIKQIATLQSITGISKYVPAVTQTVG